LKPKTTLLQQQLDFLRLNPAGGAKLLLGGMRSGKTYALLQQLWYYSRYYEGKEGLIFSITHSDVRSVLVEPFIRILDERGVRYEHNGQLHKLTVYHNKKRPSIIHYRSYEQGKITGLSVCYAILDEYDLCPDVFKHWTETVLARVSIGNPNMCNIAIGTTPEGLYFTYHYFHPQGKYYNKQNNFVYIKMKSTANPFQDVNILKKRIENLPEDKRKAYIDGEWSNFAENPCFYSFNDSRIVRLDHIDILKNTMDVIIGMDFNVSKMVSSISVDNFGVFQTLDEIVLRNSNTPAMCEALKLYREKYCKNARFIFYPDMTCKARKTNSQYSDLNIIQQNFPKDKIIMEHNPEIVDRYNVVNQMFRDKKLEVNSRCEEIINDLRAINLTDVGYFDKNALEKRGLTHAIDAFSYPIYFRYWKYFEYLSRRPRVQEFIY